MLYNKYYTINLLKYLYSIYTKRKYFYHFPLIQAT